MVVMIFLMALIHNAQEPESQQAVLITDTSAGIGIRMTEVLSTNPFFVYVPNSCWLIR